MVECQTPSNTTTTDPLHDQFLSLLPRLQTHAAHYFRDVRCPDQKADRVAEATALGWKWFRRLHDRGKDVSKFPMIFSFHVARAVRCGRRLCGQETANDALSPTAQWRHGFRVESLPLSMRPSFEDFQSKSNGQREIGTFEERLRDNTQTPVPDQAAFRIDFPAWLQTLTKRDRCIVRRMLQDEPTKELSQTFGVSAGRISQLRKELQQGWTRFTGDIATEQATA